MLHNNGYKNRRNSSVINGCRPFQLSYNLKDNCFENTYFSYT